MDWVRRMQAALEYIEENLTSDLSIAEIAKRANSSVFHFQRMFFMLSGVSVSDYVRRRRLTMAARDLITTEDSITDIASRSRELPEGMEERSFPSVTYAVFRDSGSPVGPAIRNTFTRIFQEWFPSTGYEHAEGPEIEVYRDNEHYEVWIPVSTQQ